MVRARETDIRVEPNKTGGDWYWEFTIDGEVFESGNTETEEDAKREARESRWSWEDAGNEQ